jgi:hypothetical protein
MISSHSGGDKYLHEIFSKKAMNFSGTDMAVNVNMQKEFLSLS